MTDETHNPRITTDCIDTTPLPNWAKGGRGSSATRSRLASAALLSRRADSLGKARLFARILKEARTCSTCGVARRLAQTFKDHPDGADPTGLCPKHRSDWAAVEAFGRRRVDLSEPERRELDKVRRQKRREWSDEQMAKREEQIQRGEWGGWKPPKRGSGP